jgi:AmmeMemoRadiSam system protein A
MTTDRERRLLLQVARDAITAHVAGRDEMSDMFSGDARGSAPHGAVPAEFAAPRGGVFVTIHHGGELRGCIGHLDLNDATLPLLVARCAVAACSEDPRFPPVTPAELPEIQIELSVLGPLEPAAGPADVEVGRHGLVVEMGRQRGLLLPQVATERKWDAGTLLSQTCRKAGLPADSWQHGATVWRFEAEVFSEGASH